MVNTVSAFNPRWPTDRYGPYHSTVVDILPPATGLTVVPGVMQQRIYVLQMMLIAAGDVDVDIINTGGGALVGQVSLAADGNGFVLPPAWPGVPWFVTNPGNGIRINLSAAVQVGGVIVHYIW